MSNIGQPSESEVARERNRNSVRINRVVNGFLFMRGDTKEGFICFELGLGDAPEGSVGAMVRDYFEELEITDDQRKEA